MKYILSGPTCAGKTTLANMMSRKFPALHRPVSYTTRLPKAGERNGVDYHFVSRQHFEQHIRTGQFAEWAEVHHELYGTLKMDLEASGFRGEEFDVLLEIDVQGMRRIKQKYPATSIFILPPSLEELEARLHERNRGETEIERKIRLATAKSEIACAGEFDHQVVNRDLETALRALVEIVDRKRVMA